jgi:transcriptional regulator GlxA family with amidase domain
MIPTSNPSSNPSVEPPRFPNGTAFVILSQGTVPHPRNAHVPQVALFARGGLPPRALQRVREYIAAHLEHKISNDVLAEIAGLSTCHFARAFKQSEGMSPHRYVLQSRVKRAQELLAGTAMRLSEIALAAGFSDQSHCTRCFRELTGVTPGTYRWSTR